MIKFTKSRNLPRFNVSYAGGGRGKRESFQNDEGVVEMMQNESYVAPPPAASTAETAETALVVPRALDALATPNPAPRPSPRNGSPREIETCVAAHAYAKEAEGELAFEQGEYRTPYLFLRQRETCGVKRSFFTCGPGTGCT